MVDLFIKEIYLKFTKLNKKLLDLKATIKKLLAILLQLKTIIKFNTET